MSRPAARWIALAAWSVSAVALAQSPTTLPATAPTTLPQRNVSLDKIIADLASDDWKVRQQAADLVGELDRSAIPRLRQVIDATSDVDLRNALIAAVDRIEETKLGEASLITLHVKNAPAVEVLNAIGSQLEYDLIAENTEWLNDIKVTADIDGQPFWAAMKQLSSQWPVRVTMNPNEAGRLGIVGTGNNFLTDRATIAGPFLICPYTVQSAVALDLLEPKPQPKVKSVTLSMMVLTEPKLRSSRLTVVMKDAIDEKGNSIRQPDLPVPAQGALAPQAVTVLPNNGRASFRFTVTPDTGRTIAKLSAVIRTRVPVRMRRVEMSGLAAGAEKSIDLGGRPVGVTLIAHDNLYDIRLSMPPNTNMQDELGTALMRDLVVLDAHGNALHRRSATPAMNGRSLQCTITYGREPIAFGKPTTAVGEPAKIVWTLPIEFKEIEYPFELTQIPLSQ